MEDILIPEFDNLVQDVQEVLCYSQDFETEAVAAVPDLIQKWWEAKRNLRRDIFGGNLILNDLGTVSISLTTSAKIEKAETFIESLWDDEVLREWEDLIDLKGVTDFLSYDPLAIYDNKVSCDYCKNGYNIPYGMKLLKAIKFFSDYDEPVRRIQDLASELIQQTKISGQLCLSIHPLDYLSLSENNYNWRSCHSLDGDYRVGNLSYMLDSSTIVCYIRGKNDKVKLPRFPNSVPWYDKKWRILLFFDPTMQLMYAGRPYPFFTSSIFQDIKTAIGSRLPQFKSVKWDTVIHKEAFFGLFDRTDELDCHQMVLAHQFYPINYFVRDAKYSRQFDDLLMSSKDLPRYIVGSDFHYCANNHENIQSYVGDNDLDEHIMTVGAETPCVCCGSEPTADESSFLCEYCNIEYGHRSDLWYTCDYCRRRIPISHSMHHVWCAPEETHKLSMIKVACDTCVDKVAEKCPSCGTYYENGVSLPDECHCHCAKYGPRVNPNECAPLEFVF